MLPHSYLRVKETVRLLTPNALKAGLPMSAASNQTVVLGRDAIGRILRQEDARFLVVVGPCSIHDTGAALEYAAKLNQLRQELAGRLCIVMRVSLEKPRTTIGCKGLINDPHMHDTYDIEACLQKTRTLCLNTSGDGHPTAT